MLEKLLLNVSRLAHTQQYISVLYRLIAKALKKTGTGILSIITLATCITHNIQNIVSALRSNRM